MLLLPFLQETGPCLPMSKPHLAHLLGSFVSAVLLETGRRSYDWWPCSPPHFLLLSACVCSRDVLDFFSTWTLLLAVSVLL
ncbi:hypothetical protein BC835DRAFT_1357845 [Cytidiella melzeri]|nr:hypothetical protein BC835DRAFT_1357845 [Cytidiella melzeri]